MQADLMEKKIAEYRSHKSRQQTLEKTTNYFKKAIDYITPNFSFLLPDKEEVETQKETLLEEDVNLEEIAESDDKDDEICINCWSFYNIAYYGLCFILWAILYALFIEFQFGLVFLILSAIVFIFVNTRTRPKRRGEVSAYSVFNKDCKSIDGTLKAEQFEREIRFGAGGVR